MHGEVTQRPPRCSTGDSFSFAGQVFVAEYFRIYMDKNGCTYDLAQPKLEYINRNWLAYVGKGVWARSMSYARSGRTNMMSRDQLSSNIVAMGLSGEILRDELMYSLKSLICRGLFMTNTVDNDETKKGFHVPDITGPTEWSAFIRAVLGLKSYILFPFLLLGDTQLLIDVLIKRHAMKTDPIQNSTNLICYLLQSKLSSTFISKLARRIFAPLSAVSLTAWFTRNQDEPPIHLLYVDWIQKALES